ncbi:MAG: hypothetical protein HY910_16530 [Desulfarculus sp.]|nr:hypothetical protein [Desulfarculus sp.]
MTPASRGLLMSVLLPLCLLAAGPAMADEIDAQMERGRRLYQEGKLGEALEAVEVASTLMRQKKAEAMQAVFPDPPPGWTADQAQSQAVAKVFMGGGITASRLYRQRGDKGRVKLEVVSDSPLMQGVALLLTNPLLVQSAPGAKLIRLGQDNALLTSHGESRAEVQMVVDGRLLVRAEASGLERAAETAKEFATRLDLERLRRLAR